MNKLNEPAATEDGTEKDGKRMTRATALPKTLAPTNIAQALKAAEAFQIKKTEEKHLHVKELEVALKNCQ